MRNRALSDRSLETLRQLGVSLADMSPLLNDTESMVPLLEQQLAKLQRQRVAIQHIEDKLSKLIKTLNTRAHSPDELDEILFQTLESMTMYDKYFDPSELDAMHKGMHTPGSSVSLEDAWNQWVGKMQSLLTSGVDPKSKEVQNMMQHWDEMVSHLTGNDDQKLKAFNDLLHNEPQARQDHGISDALFEFMGKASGGH